MDVVDVRGLLSLLLTDGSLVSYRTPGGGYIQLTLTAGINQSAFLDDKVREFKEFLPSRAVITPYKSSPRANGRQAAACVQHALSRRGEIDQSNSTGPARRRCCCLVLGTRSSRSPRHELRAFSSWQNIHGGSSHAGLDLHAYRSATDLGRTSSTSKAVLPTSRDLKSASRANPIRASQPHSSF